MKKGLLATTALIGAGVLVGGTAQAAEAPEWKLSGNMNFQFYNVDQDAGGTKFDRTWGTFTSGVSWEAGVNVFDTKATAQDHGWYFGVDEAELELNVEGVADNGLIYGFKIEINANTTDDMAADEARIQFSGNWGTLQLGDEDGAEDIMNYGGENLMGATGGFDGDFDDVLLRDTAGVTAARAPSYPEIAGDTGDATKISYFSPRFSGFQTGVSFTPTPNNGDDFKQDGAWENHIGIGFNYDKTFDDLRFRGSGVISWGNVPDPALKDIWAWSIGGIVDWGPYSLGANYTDNRQSQLISGSIDHAHYWNVAASYERGPLYLSVGAFKSHFVYGWDVLGRDDFLNVSLTADYSVAPGLGVYAEIDLIEDEQDLGDEAVDNATTVVIMGVKMSF